MTEGNPVKIKIEHSTIEDDGFVIACEMEGSEQMIITNVKSEAMDDPGVSPPKDPPMELAVDVEVEPINIKEEPDDLDSVQEEDVETSDNESCGKSKLSQPIQMKIELDEILETLDRIYNEAEQLLERLIVVHARNLVGSIRRHTGDDDVINRIVTKALDKWQIWYEKSTFTDLPLFYKCYICGLGWWSLEPFKSHLKKHSDVNLTVDMEATKRQSNIIAYLETDSKPPHKNVEIEGLCLRCEKNPYYHYHNGTQKTTYTCKDCLKEFKSCSTLHQHVLADVTGQYKCKVCKNQFKASRHLKNHLTFFHTVRSDVPVVSCSKLCIYCSRKYFVKELHTCSTVLKNKLCGYCNQKFASEYLLHLHNELNKGSVDCYVCKQTFDRKCSVFLHLVKHSKLFKMHKYCHLCGQIVRNRKLRLHLQLFHYKENAFQKTSELFSDIIVPKYLLDAVEHDSLLDTNTAVDIPLPVEPVAAAENELTTAILGLKQEMDDDHDYFAQPVMEKKQIAHEEEPPTLTYEQLLSNLLNLPEDTVEHDTAETDVMYEDYEDDIIKLDLDDISQMRLKGAEEIKQEIKVEEDDEPTDVILDEFVKLEPIDDELESDEQEESDDEEQCEINDFCNEMQEVVQSDDDDLIEIIPQQESIEVSSGEDDCSETSDTDYEVQNQADKAGSSRKNCARCRFKNCRYLNRRRSKKIIRQPTFNFGSTYKCTKCDTVYPIFQRYVEHFIEHGHMCNMCPVCLKVWPSPSQVTTHFSRHVRDMFARIRFIEDSNSIKQYQCRECKETCDMKDMFEHFESHVVLHKMKKETNQPTVVIRGLTKPYKNNDYVLPPDVLKEAISYLFAKPQRYQTMACCICKKIFNRNNDQKRHVIGHLLTDANAKICDTAKLKCQICDDLLISAAKYKNHMREHSSLPIYKCLMCDKTFSDSSNFTKHKKVHNLQAYNCDICNRKFQLEESLEKHLEMHKTSKPINCEPCNKAFFIESDYNRHRRMYHEVTSHSMCKICSMKFYSSKQKLDHMWEVHNQRQSIADCKVCGAKFRKLNDLKHHLKSKHWLKWRAKKNNRVPEDVAAFLKIASATNIKKV